MNDGISIPMGRAWWEASTGRDQAGVHLLAWGNPQMLMAVSFSLIGFSLHPMNSPISCLGTTSLTASILEAQPTQAAERSQSSVRKPSIALCLVRFIRHSATHASILSTNIYQVAIQFQALF